MTGDDLCSLIERRIGYRPDFEARARINAFLDRQTELAKNTLAVDLEQGRLTSEGCQGAIAAATNRQTSFMRDETQLAALERAIVKLARKRKTPIEIWCAGCSTGEEAYTLALLARRSGVVVKVTATDVCLEALEHARRGHYGDHTLRHVKLADRLAYFRAERPGYVVRPALSDLVSFRYHNLLEDRPLLPTRNGARWDVIVCRHVLMYFDELSAERIVRDFAAVLDGEGLLLLSSAEQLAKERGGLGAVDLGGARAYGHTRIGRGTSLFPRASKAPRARTSLAPMPKTELSLEAALTRGDYGHAAELLERAVKQKPSDDQSWITLGNVRLTRHEFAGAEEAYTRATACSPTDFEPHVMLGLCYLKQARLEDAKRELRSALFLAPNDWISMFLLAGVHGRLQNNTEERRLLARCREVLADPEIMVRYRGHHVNLSPLCLTTEQAQEACTTRLRVTTPAP